jgi:hypothetical protein
MFHLWNYSNLKKGKFRKKCFFKEMKFNDENVFHIGWFRYWQGKIEEFYPPSALLDIKVKEQYHKIFNSGYFQKPTFLFDIFAKISLIFAPLGPYQQLRTNWWAYSFEWKNIKGLLDMSKSCTGKMLWDSPFLTVTLVENCTVQNIKTCARWLLTSW